MTIRRGSLVLLVILSVLLLTAGCSTGGDAQGPGEVPEAGIPDGEDIQEPELTEEEKLALLLEEHRALEETRKQERGDFYVPLPEPGQEREIPTVRAKGLYVSAHVAGFSFDEEKIEYYAQYIRDLSGKTGNSPDGSRVDQLNKLERILGICRATEVNALVIDVKNDDGLVSWDSAIPVVDEVAPDRVITMKNTDRLMSYLQENDIYTIARIVVFKDPLLADRKPQHAIQLKAGGVYRDRSNTAWVNPFDPYVWDYNIALAQEAALRGFDEIQYDYVRFPDNARTYNPITEFPGREDRRKDEGIQDFLLYSRKHLEPYGVHQSADVFGVITRSWEDYPEDIGQTWLRIAPNTEYICPMIYPSHYSTGWYGYKYPDAEPYGVLRAALLEGLEKNAALKEPAIIRPWIQGFTASWVPGYIKYTPEVIARQIVAGLELGIDEYLIWSAGNNYDPRIFFYEPVDPVAVPAGKDILGRTPEEALKRYLEAEKRTQLDRLFLLTPVESRPADSVAFDRQWEERAVVLKDYTVESVGADQGSGAEAKVSYRYESPEGVAEESGASYRIVKEHQVYKVFRPELTFRKPESGEDNQ